PSGLLPPLPVLAGPPAGVVFRKSVSVCDFIVITGFFVVNLWFPFFCDFLSWAMNWLAGK
ncbi:TPA: hypothetical protein ACW72Z_004316, partial [Aeromonas veronii]